MKKHVKEFVRRCLTCQEVKAEHQRPTRLLQPLEVAKWKWEHITMDFVTRLPRMSQGHEAMWVIVNRLTKFAHFLAVRMTFTLEEFLQVIYTGDCLVARDTSVHSIGSGSQVYGSFLEEFPTSHRDTIDDEHCFSSPNGRSVGEGHLNIRRHATGMHP